MLKYGPYDIPGPDYFRFKNCFIGSNGDMRFKLTPSDEGIKVEIWLGEKCYELSQIEDEAEFPLEENSLYKINDYLSQYQKSLR